MSIYKKLLLYIDTHTHEGGIVIYTSICTSSYKKK